MHLTNNDQFYENDSNETGKDNGIFDLSTSASSSTTNTITTSQTRLTHDDIVTKNHLEDNQHHNGAGTSKKILKLSPPQHLYSNSSNLVTVMMDDKSHDTEEHSFYMPHRRDIENGHNQMEFEEGKFLKLQFEFRFQLMNFQIQARKLSRKLNAPIRQTISPKKKMKTFSAVPLNICNRFS